MRAAHIRYAVLPVILLMLVSCGTPPERRAAVEPEVEKVVPPGTIFIDAFLDKDLDGWDPLTGSWRSGEGILKQTNSSSSKMLEGFRFLVVEELIPVNSRVEVELQFPGTPRRQAFAGVVFRFRDQFNYYYFRLCDFAKYQDRAEIYRMYQGERYIKMASMDITVNPEQWYHLMVETDGPVLRAFLDGDLVGEVVDNSIPQGTHGVATGKTGAAFRNFKIEDL